MTGVDKKLYMFLTRYFLNRIPQLKTSGPRRGPLEARTDATSSGCCIECLLVFVGVDVRCYVVLSSFSPRF